MRGDDTDNILTAVRNICCVSVGIYLLRLITDGTRLKKQAAFVLKLIFAVVFAAVVIKGCKEFRLPEISKYEKHDYSASAEMYRNEVERKASENISDILYSQLKAAGIDIKDLQTEVNISEDGSIDISRVIISSADPAAAAELIRKSLGQETEVINGTDRKS